MTDTAPRRWRIRTPDGTEYGPYTRTRLDELERDGRLIVDTPVAEEGSTEWRRAGDVAELAALFATRGDHLPPRVAPPRSGNPDVAMAHVVYGLYLAGLLPVLPLIAAIAGVIIAYVKRDDVEGTWLESHFTWQIQTFWWGLGGFAVGTVLSFVLIGFLILPLVAVWFLYRIVKGWIRLGRDQPIENPTGLF